MYSLEESSGLGNQDRRVHTMAHGMYIRIQVPRPQGQDLDTEVAIRFAVHLHLPCGRHVQLLSLA